MIYRTIFDETKVEREKVKGGNKDQIIYKKKD